MESRILIPNGLRIVTSSPQQSSPVRQNAGINKLKLSQHRGSDEEAEEKPSSSSGHCETSDHDHDPDSDKEKPQALDGKSSPQTRQNDDNMSSSEISLSSEESEDETTEQETNAIGSSERGRKRGRCFGATRRRRKRRKETPENVQGDLLNKGHETSSLTTQVKICATKVIEKGTVFSANDGDVQVVHLTGIPAIGKDDIRFIFGCFETISAVSSTSSTPPPEISPSDSSPDSDKKFIRLCNWIRFLPTTSGGEKFTDFANVDFGSTSKSSIDNGHNRDKEHFENEKKRIIDFSVNPSSTNFDNDSSSSTNICKRQVRKCNNIIARFVDGRPIFEVITRLVPGTEIVAYFDVQSVITQAPSFAAMMMMSNMQMFGVPLTQPPLPLPSDNISSSTSITTPSSTLISSSSPGTSAALATVGLGKDDFVSLKSMKNERDERDREEKQHHQERLLQLYQNTFPVPHFQQFPHNPFGIHQGYGSWLRNSVGSRGSYGDYLKEEGKVEKEDKDENESDREDKDFEEEHDKRKSTFESPLDLSKLSSPSSTPDDVDTDINRSDSPQLGFSSEPLKVGTPFDSPDSNNEDVLCKANVKSNHPRSDSQGSTSIFSIRNVLGKQSSPKLFQPYCLDNRGEKDQSFDEGQSRNSSAGHLFRTSSLATPPSSADSPMAVVIRTSQKIGPILRTRGRERSLLPCEVCGKAFDRPSLLKRHLRTHTGEKPHICDVCSKGFSTSSSLNTHRRIHSGEKPHQCPICGKRFTASSNLYYHRMTHNKEKPHKCLLCGKSFPTPGDLKSHQYVHSGSWPYTCPVCHRGFSKQTNLRNHLLLHSGISSAPVNKMAEKSHKKVSQGCNVRTFIKSHEDSEQKLSMCSVCKQSLPASMILEGKCQGCMLNIPSLSSHSSNRGLMLGGASLRKQPSSPSSPTHHQFTHKMSSLQLPKSSIFDQSILHHRNSTQDSLVVQNQAVGGPITLQQSVAPNLSTFHLGSLGLPQMPGFAIPGLGIPAAASSVQVPGGLQFPLSQTTTSTPGAAPSTVAAAAAAAAATASLFRTSQGTPSSLQPNSNAILEQILEWNYRFAKESAGNLGLSIVQQKLLESQVLAAQLMSQQCSQQQSSGFGVGGMMPETRHFQEYFKMRGAGAASLSSAFPRVEAVSSENKFGQR